MFTFLVLYLPIELETNSRTVRICPKVCLIKITFRVQHVNTPRWVRSEVNIPGLYPLHQFRLVLLINFVLILLFYDMNREMTILEFIV